MSAIGFNQYSPYVRIYFEYAGTQLEGGMDVEVGRAMYLNPKKVEPINAPILSIDTKRESRVQDSFVSNIEDESSVLLGNEGRGVILESTPLSTSMEVEVYGLAQVHNETNPSVPEPSLLMLLAVSSIGIARMMKGRK